MDVCAGSVISTYVAGRTASAIPRGRVRGLAALRQRPRARGRPRKASDRGEPVGRLFLCFSPNFYYENGVTEPAKPNAQELILTPRRKGVSGPPHYGAPNPPRQLAEVGLRWIGPYPNARGKLSTFSHHSNCKNTVRGKFRGFTLFRL